MIRLASSNPFDPYFWSLSNTNLVVAMAFVIFIAFLVYKGVPKLIAGMLDKRAEGIRAELDEARRLRDEAQELFAEFERKTAEVQKEADEIVKAAKKSADAHAKESEAKLAAQIERRVANGKEQIAAAEAAVEGSIRKRAAAIAIESAREVMLANATAKDASSLIDAAIADVETNLN